MKGSAGKIQLASLDELFGVSRGENVGEPFQKVPLSDLHPFKNHPFHVTDDEKMQELADSIAQHGVLVPGIVRPRLEGGYELVSGHRRKRACELAGLTAMPVLVRELDDDEATLIMVDSNLQREKILPSEKAFAYRMKLEAMKHQGQRVDLTLRPVGTRSDELLANKSPDSARQIQRYIRLTYLHPLLLQMVDENKLVLRPTVEVSYLPLDDQMLLYDVIEEKSFGPPSMEQAKKLREYCERTTLTTSLIIDILTDEKPNPEKITLKKKCLNKYFPHDYTKKQMEEIIFSLLDAWKSQQEGVCTGDENG